MEIFYILYYINRSFLIKQQGEQKMHSQKSKDEILEFFKKQGVYAKLFNLVGTVHTIINHPVFEHKDEDMRYHYKVASNALTIMDEIDETTTAKLKEHFCEKFKKTISVNSDLSIKEPDALLEDTIAVFRAEINLTMGMISAQPSDTDKNLRRRTHDRTNELNDNLKQLLLFKQQANPQNSSAARNFNDELPKLKAESKKPRRLIDQQLKTDETFVNMQKVFQVSLELVERKDFKNHLLKGWGKNMLTDSLRTMTYINSEKTQSIINEVKPTKIKLISELNIQPAAATTLLNKAIFCIEECLKIVGIKQNERETQPPILKSQQEMRDCQNKLKVIAAKLASESELLQAAKTNYKKASLVYTEHNYKAAITLYQKALKAFENCLFTSRHDIASSYYCLAQSYIKNQDPTSAKIYAEKAAPLLKRIATNSKRYKDIFEKYSKRNEDLLIQISKATSSSNEETPSRYDNTKKSYKNSQLKIINQTNVANQAIKDAKNFYSKALVIYKEQRYQDAIQLFEETLRLLEQALQFFKQDKPKTLLPDISAACYNLASTYMRLSEQPNSDQFKVVEALKQAESLLLRTVGIREKMIPQEDAKIKAAQARLADCQQRIITIMDSPNYSELIVTNTR